MRRAATGLALVAILVAPATGCAATRDAPNGTAGSRTGTGGTGSSEAPVSPGSGKTYPYTVPAGSAQRIKAGERPDLFPQHLELRVGDRIRIKNEDSEGHTVGPYYVGPGETLEQTFTTPTTIEGFCSLHPESQVKIVVT